MDSPSSEDWFRHAWGLSWPRDPFDRLIVAHTRLRGWRLATGDRFLLDRLSPGETRPHVRLNLLRRNRARRPYRATMDPVTTVVAGNWYHLVGTYDGATAILYVNGVQVASSHSALYSVNFSQPVTVGGRYESSFFFRGAVDEVAIYTNLLSAAEVLAHYQNGINTTPSSPYDTLVLAQNPLAYWRMDDTAVPFASAVNLGYIGSAGNGSFNGSSGTATNDTPLVGDSDSALYFPGSSRIDIPLNEALVRTNAFS